LTGEFKKGGLFRILSLDGGGAKGFYTLGVLKEIEGVLKCPLYQCFDLIFGTSTGSRSARWDAEISFNTATFYPCSLPSDCTGICATS
jgi:hypothetical protein